MYGRRPGEYTNVSTKTEVLIPLFSWVLACATADIGILGLGLIVMMVSWWVVGLSEWWQWFCAGWQWWVVGLVAPWPAIGIFLIIGYIGEIHFKDAHKDTPRSPVWAFLFEVRQLFELLGGSQTTRTYEKRFTNKKE